jgi:hypothetical protein
MSGWSLCSKRALDHLQSMARSNEGEALNRVGDRCRTQRDPVSHGVATEAADRSG